jgi:hypothetical protein
LTCSSRSASWRCSSPWPTAGRHAAAWLVTALGLAVSVAGNVGHVTGHSLSSRATAAVPPLAAAAALAVGLGVLKRVVAGHGAPDAPAAVLPAVAADAESAARAALSASVAAGNPLSQRQVVTRFGLTRAAERKVRQAALAASNGHVEGGDQ